MRRIPEDAFARVAQRRRRDWRSSAWRRSCRRDSSRRRWFRDGGAAWRTPPATVKRNRRGIRPVEGCPASRCVLRGGPRASPGTQTVGRRGRRCRDVCVDTFSRRAVYCVALRGRRRLCSCFAPAGTRRARRGRGTESRAGSGPRHRGGGLVLGPLDGPGQREGRGTGRGGRHAAGFRRRLLLRSGGDRSGRAGRSADALHRRADRRRRRAGVGCRAGPPGGLEHRGARARQRPVRGGDHRAGWPVPGAGYLHGEDRRRPPGQGGRGS